MKTQKSETIVYSYQLMEKILIWFEMKNLQYVYILSIHIYIKYIYKYNTHTCWLPPDVVVQRPADSSRPGDSSCLEPEIAATGNEGSPWRNILFFRFVPNFVFRRVYIEGCVPRKLVIAISILNGYVSTDNSTKLASVIQNVCVEICQCGTLWKFRKRSSHADPIINMHPYIPTSLPTCTYIYVSS